MFDEKLEFPMTQKSSTPIGKMLTDVLRCFLRPPPRLFACGLYVPTSAPLQNAKQHSLDGPS